VNYLLQNNAVPGESSHLYCYHDEQESTTDALDSHGGRRERMGRLRSRAAIQNLTTSKEVIITD